MKIIDRIALDKAIAGLPNGYRTVFILHDVEGFEHEEIARMLQERDVILNSVREGIININSNGCITLVNSEAQLLLKQAGIEGVNELFGKC